MTKTKECRGKKKVCPFLLLENSIPLSPPWEPQTPLSLGTPRLLINLPRIWLSLVCLVKAVVFLVVMYGCESWTMKKAEHWNWCFWSVALGKTLQSLLEYKESQPVHPKGNQSWMFIGRTDAEAETPIVWPSDAKNWLIWEDPDAGNYWRQEEKGMTEDEMIEWHHWLDEHEFE